MAISNLRLQPQAPETKSEGLKPIPPKVSPEQAFPKATPAPASAVCRLFQSQGVAEALSETPVEEGIVALESQIHSMDRTDWACI